VRKYSSKIVIVVCLLLLSLYFLFPTYRDYSLRNTLATLTDQDSVTFVEQNQDVLRENRLKRIKLGLDLQGGMRVVLEVNVLKLLEDLAKNKDDVFTTIMHEVREQSKTSEESPVTLLRREFEERQIRMSRYYLTLRSTDDEVTSFLEDESVKAIDRGMEIVRNRVDQYGVSEPSIQKLGGTRIIVELPGVSNESEVRQLLQGTALLEFKLLRDPEITYKVMESIDKALAASTSTNTSDTSSVSSDTSAISTPEGEMSREEFVKKHPFFGVAVIDPQNAPGEAFVLEENKEKVRRILEREDVRRLIPRDMQFLWSAKGRLAADGNRVYTLYAVKSAPELTGGVVTSARANIDPSFNQPIVTMEMSSEGAREWARITGANINKRVAIVLDNGVFSAPVVRNKISGGNSQIEGMESIEEARLLEIVLKAGALPAPVEIIEHRSVGPSLGEDSVQSGLESFIFAVILTAGFIIIYYRTGGVVATFGMLVNGLFIFAILAAFKGTLTLPGVAGIVLAIGMSIDGNVLIFERIREELASGKTLRAGIDAGYTKAFSAIIDSNLTTFFSGLVLYQFGTGPIQGFALTLMMGVAANLFTSITFTRLIFNVMMERGKGVINFG